MQWPQWATPCYGQSWETQVGVWKLELAWGMGWEGGWGEFQMGLGIPLTACRQSGQLPRRASETWDSSPRSFPNIRILAVLKSESRSDLKGKWADYYTLAMRWTTALRLVHKTHILLTQTDTVMLFTENIQRLYKHYFFSTLCFLVVFWSLNCHFEWSLYEKELAWGFFIFCVTEWHQIANN